MRSTAIGPARPDVVLLDTMGSPGDTTLLRRIRSEAPQARVIVYSGYVSLLDDGELGAEADAYIEKGDDERRPGGDDPRRRRRARRG